MSTRERPIDRGRRLATADRLRIGHELRVARRVTGKSVHIVGSAAGMSGAQVARIERGILPTVSVDQLARIGAVVGLDVRVRAYPGPDPTLDAAQAGLLGRLRDRLAADLGFRTEVPLPIAGDKRAWDAVIDRLRGIASVLPVEAESRFVDGQAQVRRVMLKLRDSGLDSVLLVVADTRANRRAVAAASSILLADFPIPARRALAALAAGDHPAGSAIVLL
ncbi:MAG TPA: helix-turn-helix transcriptional regulator [Candidatus Limnocylindrales bacterium]|nr:helix-turn-helix transcriptional regulator [Candidatus Limnocylindrales bacterium]